MAAEETRRCEAQAYIKDHPDALWVVHPMGVNEPEFSMTGAEVLHSLPCCDGVIPPPASSETLRAALTVNVRVAPSTSALKAGSIPQGETVAVTERATADGYDWRKLADGRGWIAAKKLDSGTVYLVPLA